MTVLGFNGFSRARGYFAHRHRRVGRDRFRLLGHDAGAAVIEDGVLVAAVEEERITRERKTSRFPAHAISFCVEQVGGWDSIDYVAFPWRFDADARRCYIASVGGSAQEVADWDAFVDGVAGPDRVVADFRDHFGLRIAEEQFRFVSHHVAHAAAGCLFTGTDSNADILVVDGRGEWLSSTCASLEGRTLRQIDDGLPIRDSIGLFYSKVTRYLGYTPNSDEYKVMGLSSYGDRNRFMPQVARFLRLGLNGTYKLGYENTLRSDQEYMDAFDDAFSDSGERGFSWMADVAAFAQYVVETAVLHRARWLQSMTGNRTLVVDGGVALNCVCNARLARESGYHDVQVSFATHDGGTAAGAAASIFWEYALPLSRCTPALGPSYSYSEIADVLVNSEEHIVECRSYEQMCRVIAHHLADRKVVGWFQGRMELGPRALGYRSILAEPSDTSVRDSLNNIKHRESFRPFAPCILADRATEYFEMRERERSPYMTRVFRVKEEKMAAIAGTVHVDRSCRLQTVERDDNPLLWRLLKEYEMVTGVPCLLNTSFNIAGEPIVMSPAHAIDTFRRSGIDVLVMDRVIVTR